MIRDGRKYRPSTVAIAQLLAPRAPFRAEVPAESILCEWRDHIEEAMDDARKYAPGSRVVAQDGTLIARFENSLKHTSPHLKKRAAV